MEEEKSKEGDQKNFSAAFSTDMQMTHPPTHPPPLDPPPLVGKRHQLCKGTLCQVFFLILFSFGFGFDDGSFGHRNT